ncbi:MAG TPA: hypothetical protein VHO06_26975 [Polyangia bacterium]|nr:hypothetical protein [Polyangia bacterium]
MPLAEFEEKELEGPLNAQLTGGSGRIWTPGQVLESIVGFDAALMVTDVSFWASVGFGPTPSGLPVSPLWWPDWPSVLLRPVLRFRDPPPFRLNLFLQYKRPQHLKRGKEWRHWRSAYFRFDLTPHQQLALESCANSLGADGHVAYGSPAFFRRADLFAHTEGRTLAANTHFAPVLRLAKHSRYTYVSAHSAGKGHSDPVSIHPLSLSFPDGPHDPPPPPSDGGGGDGHTPDGILSAAKKAARAAVDASPLIVGSREAFDRAIERARGLLGLVRPPMEERGSSAADNYLVASQFAYMSRVQWLVQS